MQGHSSKRCVFLDFRSAFHRPAPCGCKLLILASVVISLLYHHPVFAEEAKEAEDDEPCFERVIEELFLGIVVYPQERGELQLSNVYRSAHKRTDDFQLETFIEYGITDRFQIAADLPVDFLRAQPEKVQGLGNVEIEAYYNFYNNKDYTKAYGAGFVVGLPSATTGIGERAMSYEAYLVGFRELKPFYINLYAAIEFEDPFGNDDFFELGDPFESDDKSGVSGDISLAVFRKYDRFVLDLELGVRIEEDETPVRLAPALYWHPRAWKNSEFAVALPVGLTGETP